MDPYLEQYWSEVHASLIIYHDGRYQIDYREPLVPQLSAKDEAWAAALLREQKCR